MKRYNLYISDNQLETFTKLSENKDISVSELMRRALDDYISKEIREPEVQYGKTSTKSKRTRKWIR